MTDATDETMDALGPVIQSVTFEILAKDAEHITWLLRRRYEKDEQTGLDRLCRLAVLEITAREAVEYIKSLALDRARREDPE